MTVRHTLHDLARDLGRIPAEATRGFAHETEQAARAGCAIAKASARRTAGAHGRKYADAFDVEMINPLAWEYGPDADHPGGQGGMSFEYGSRNQKPHLDLARSADQAGVAHHRGINRVLDGLFW